MKVQRVFPVVAQDMAQLVSIVQEVKVMVAEVEISRLIQMKLFRDFHVMILHLIHMVPILKPRVREPKRLDFPIFNQVKQVSKVMEVVAVAVVALVRAIHLPAVALRKSFLNSRIEFRIIDLNQ